MTRKTWLNPVTGRASSPLRRLGAAALSAVAAMSLGACAVLELEAPTAPTPTANVRAAALEPADSLLPAVTEQGNQAITQSLYAGLVYYDSEGSRKNDIATAILRNRDCTVFDIEIADDLTFTDGTQVRAQSFIQSWTWAAQTYKDAAQLFAPIRGFADLTQNPQVGLKGLEEVGERRFKIHLEVPTCDFAERLGHPVFVPLPAAAFSAQGEITTSFAQNPFGYGPYMLARDGAWERSSRLTLVRNQRYRGPREAKNDGVVFTFENKAGLLWHRLLEDKLDVHSELPVEAKDQKDSLLRDRVQDLVLPTQLWLVLPAVGQLKYEVEPVDGTAADDAGLEGLLRREAIARSIDREKICADILNERCQVVADFMQYQSNYVVKAVTGNQAVSALPETMQFNLAKAGELWRRADALQAWEIPLTLGYVEEAHEVWIQEIAQILRQSLSIEVKVRRYSSQQALFADIAGGQLVLYPQIVRAKYPSSVAMLEPLLDGLPAAGFENSDIAEYRQLLERAWSSQDIVDSQSYFQQLTDSLATKLPAVPLWRPCQYAGWAETINPIHFDWQGTVQYWQITAR